AQPALLAVTWQGDSSVALAGAAPVARLFDAARRAEAEQAFDRAFDALVARATRRTGDSLLDLDAVAAATPCARWFGDARRGGAGVPDACTRRWPIVHAQHGG
ncbi:hypothetical protein RZS08_64225, partial [Arthrospira platensis SPKY1]|nr:hypothetical protein [Arthrospira platensis SPKY1]